MKQKPYADMVAEKAGARLDQISEKVKAMIGDVPFGAKPVGGRHAVEVFRSLTPEEIGMLQQEFGSEHLAQVLLEVSKTEKRLKGTN